MHNRKNEKWISTYIFFKTGASSGISLRLLFFPLSLSFKITGYNEKLVVSNKSLSLQAPAILVDQKQPHIKHVFFNKVHEKSPCDVINLFSFRGVFQVFIILYILNMNFFTCNF